ncbi:hypothetical protein E2C01_062685 [Portunus trituberculatus]|uniref:Uncharacterized protein n=1 Tax=Portunus trituberculatus TaxID=210409 RepID=A0A5B7HED0_PORTR|nr:hypothetical protein [Portunus trituberculatus]
MAKWVLYVVGFEPMRGRLPDPHAHHLIHYATASSSCCTGARSTSSSRYINSWDSEGDSSAIYPARLLQAPHHHWSLQLSSSRLLHHHLFLLLYNLLPLYIPISLPPSVTLPGFVTCFGKLNPNPQLFQASFSIYLPLYLAYCLDLGTTWGQSGPGPRLNTTYTPASPVSVTTAL